MAVTLSITAQGRGAPVLLSGMPEASAAHSPDAFSAATNPALSALFGDFTLAYRFARPHGDGAETGHFGLVNLMGFFARAGRVESLVSADEEDPSDAGFNCYMAGKGFMLGNVFGFGAAYSWTPGGGGPYSGYHSWSAGMLLRPFPFLSLAWAANDINEPSFAGERLQRTDRFSMAVRPFAHYLTLGCDWVRTGGDGRFLFSASLVLPNDCSLTASADTDKTFSAGLALPIDLPAPQGLTAVPEYAVWANRHGLLASSGGFTLTGRRYPSTALPSARYLELRLSEPLQESPVDNPFGESPPSFYDILSAVRQASRDPHIRGIILRIDQARLGFARTQELRAELAAFRSSGRKLFAVMTRPGNSELYLASAAERIYYNPAEPFFLPGLSADVYFFRELLDRIGIRFDSTRRGRFKFFNEPFTARRMSREYRESITALLTDLNNQFVEGVAAGRSCSRRRLEEIIGAGIMPPDQALAAGMVDILAYPDQAQEMIGREAGPRFAVISLDDYRAQDRHQWRWGALPRIAVLHVGGAIVRENDGGAGPASGAVAGDESYRRMLDTVFADRSVRAVVIRIDSGGGSAAASDMMRHYLLRAKKESPRPVVFSFGNTAASGGYYIATTGDRIYASAGSITGSIGVISGKITLQGLYEKIGVRKETVKLGEFADLFTESRNLTEKEKDAIEKSVEFIYRKFTACVSEGRRIAPGDIEPLAEGRVFTGEQASRKKLVDEIGGLTAAIEYARIASGIRGEFEVLSLPRRKTSLISALISSSLGSTPEARLVHAIRETAPEASALCALASGGESALLLFPYTIVIR